MGIAGEQDRSDPASPTDIEFWESVLANLRRRGDEKVRRALRIGHLLDQGLRPGEIRAQIGCTAREYGRAVAWLGDAITKIPRGD